MKSKYTLLIGILLLFIQCRQTAPFQNISLPGLTAPVEILVDRYGIPHIYADTEEDLFFAQGYYACMDRLFQFEVWRMQATGTVAKVLGERELQRDIGTRLFKFRGDMDAEMNHYHPKGKLIIESYVSGVNAYIDRVLANTSLLPPEFRLLDILPEHWTPEVVISRHQGLLGNIGQELTTGRMVATIGEEATKRLNWFHPNDPDLTLDRRLTKEVLDQDILGIYNAFRRPVRFEPEDVKGSIGDLSSSMDLYNDLVEDPSEIGSNNWTVSGQRMASGHAVMANDPHRRIAVPSLRYMAHLVGPGWNVIGGGEPEIPGISIGHNGIGAWGLTVHRTDAEDLYFYETNPSNPNQYRHNGEWVEMKIINESIPVKGQEDHIAELKYTIHGPVVFEDSKKNLAFAVRCGWLEIGGAPYLASLR
ncbi:MAG: penicillin acylase family protein, partial [Bacteroidia bacterium]|nr:penicillin acylase family protein [Bacteroidia bacterium]